MQLTRETLAYSTEAQWLAARRRDLTSTECAALFGVSPYCTEFELHHRKAGTLPADDFTANERMKWGNRLEDAIARGIAEDMGLIVEPFKVYMRIVELRMGSSFDFKVVGLVDGCDDNPARDLFRRHGPGLMEVKNVDGLQFRRAWIDDGETIEAPPQIEFQAQHQLEVADLNWSIIAPLVGGNTPKPILRVRDLDVCAAIRERVGAFWRRYEQGTAPQPDYVKDADTIGRLYLDNDGSAIDLSHDPRVFELCMAYKGAPADAKLAEERKSAAKAELLTIIKAAKSVSAAGYKISAGTNKESYRCYTRSGGERVTITVSQVPPAAVEAVVAPFRNVRITEAK